MACVSIPVAAVAVDASTGAAIGAGVGAAAAGATAAGAVGADLAVDATTGAAIGAGAGGAIDATTGAAIGATSGADAASSLGAVAAPTTDIIGGADTIGAGAVDPATGAPLSSIAPGTSGAVSTPVSGAVAPGANLAPASGGVATPSASGDIASSAINSQVATPGATALDASAPTTNVGSLLNAPAATADTTTVAPDASLSTGTGGVNAGADTGGLDLLPGDSEELASTNPAGTATVNDVLNPGGVPASSSGGFWNSVDKVISNPAFKLGAAVLPTAATLIRGQPAVPSQIQPLTSSGAVTAPLISAENTALGEATSGTLTPGQAASVGQYIQQSQDALYQQLANEGVTNPTSDSRYIAGMQQIQQQAQIMTQSYITQAFTTGFAAAGQATTDLTAAANAQIQTDQEFQSALNSAMTSFGLIQGGGALASLAKAP